MKDQQEDENPWLPEELQGSKGEAIPYYREEGEVMCCYCGRWYDADEDECPECGMPVAYAVNEAYVLWDREDWYADE